MKRNKESKARVRIFSWLGLNKSEQMEVDRYLKKHNSNYRVLYKKFKMFNEILMTAADLGFGDEYYSDCNGLYIVYIINHTQGTSSLDPWETSLCFYPGRNMDLNWVFEGNK